ncbi:hypothetical protein MCW_01377 [Cardidatus Bartonella washoeensis 085-0475]|uniref:Uncharacterized protein n=1 Tax=Cardidatus Bartonella washoeensis 085-0475 TaxID=1094564 RepID=J0Z6M2_9HYPH|nr:hypothetical protein MCW_01377 [Bartonella washoeensis 085-0475]
MSKTAFAVPESTVIYSNNANAYIRFSEGTSVSGNLLLKAVNNSSVRVDADASKLRGGCQVYGRATADLYLMHGSEWILTNNTRRESREFDFTDSSISSVALSDSTIVFDEHVSNGYQTLRIGRKIDEAGVGKLTREVYSAEGNVQIKLNVFLNNDGSFVPQKTDRILIYGDVSGTTLVHMQNFPKIPDKKVHEGRDQSISIIQVSGIA